MGSVKKLIICLFTEKNIMTKEEILEGNKLIAEFMEFISDKANVYRVPNLFPFKGYESGYTELSLWAIGFEKDWNMLMPVVEKISRIEFHREMQDLGAGEIETIIYTHFPRTFGMLNNKTGNPMFRYNSQCVFEAETLIEAAWLATVDFIKFSQP